MVKEAKQTITLDDCTLYHGDAMKIMLELVIKEKLRANCLVCDPPYLLTTAGASEGGLHERIGGAGYDNGGHLVPCDVDWNDFMPLFYRIMERGHAYVMANNRNVEPMLNAARKAGFEFHNLLVWDKQSATPNRWYMKNCEFTGLFYKGKARRINDCGSMACIRYPQKDESNHPTEKPVALMEYYILNSTQPGDLVIDPFMGSGTTGVACARTGRRFVGIELDDGYFDESVRRIKDTLEGYTPRLF